MADGGVSQIDYVVTNRTVTQATVTDPSGEPPVALVRYRRALRAKQVSRAEDWRWSSLWQRDQRDDNLTTWLTDWPVERPRDWLTRVHRPQSASELASLRTSVQRGRPFGEEAWVRRMAKQFGMEATLRPRGRPKGS